MTATLAILFGNGTIDRWLSSYGYAAVFAMVAVESLGVPVPGETTPILAALAATGARSGSMSAG